jgi:hypothetical protein
VAKFRDFLDRVPSRRSPVSAIIGIVLSGLLLLHALLPAQAQAGKIDEVGPLTEAAVPTAILQSLSPNGYRITPEGGGAGIAIWYCKDIAVQSKSPASDAVYDRLPESALLGVLHFAKNSNDYRGQSIVAGYYTLRYALMPNDGNHLGVAPGRDFLLLVPAGADPGLQKPPTVAELVVLSSRTTGTRHPAPMSLVPATSDGSKPALSKDDQGDLIFTTAVRLASGEALPIALVVKGSAPQ